MLKALSGDIKKQNENENTKKIVPKDNITFRRNNSFNQNIKKLYCGTSKINTNSDSNNISNINENNSVKIFQKCSNFNEKDNKFLSLYKVFTKYLNNNNKEIKKLKRSKSSCKKIRKSIQIPRAIYKKINNKTKMSNIYKSKNKNKSSINTIITQVNKSTKNIFRHQKSNPFLIYNSFYPEKINQSKENSQINTLKDIYYFESYLTHKEDQLIANINNKKEEINKINLKLNNSINMLKLNINETYSELAKLKNIFYKENKNMLKTFYVNKRIRIQNKNNNELINNLKNDINIIISKISQLKNETIIINNNCKKIYTEIDIIKKESKKLPAIINSLEEENKNLIKAQLLLDSKMKDLNGKIYLLEYNKKNIVRNFRQTRNIYKINHIID